MITSFQLMKFTSIRLQFILTRLINFVYITDNWLLLYTEIYLIIFDQLVP